jgi:hypothetical protein
MSVLRAKYGYQLDQVVQARFRASNIYGWGEYGLENTVGAQI